MGQGEQYVTHHAKPSLTGSTRADGNNRKRSLLAIFAFVLCALGTGASSASAEPPVVTMGTVTGASYASAHVTGEVDPKGKPTEYFFEVSTNGTDWQGAGVSGNFFDSPPNSPQPVAGDLQNLKGGTTYKVRLTAYNTEEYNFISSDAPYPEFTTLPVDPPAYAAADDASEVAYTTAKATGEVERPSGNADPAFDVNCRFEYLSDQQVNDNLAASEPGFANAASADCEQNPITAEGTKEAVSADLGGLQVNTTYHLRLHAENAGGSLNAEAPDTFTTLNPSSPVVTIDPVTTFGATTAKFSGHVTPGGTDPTFDTNWEFHCTPDCPNVSIGSSPTANPIPADSASHVVSGEATGLEPNTEYQVELTATNGGGPSSAGPVAFKTTAVGPDAVTIPAFVLEGGTSALVGARVNPHNSATTWWIEYGLTESYGQSVPASEDAAAGSGNQFNFLTQAISGLSLDTTYHFRVTAKNAMGEVHGEDRTFSTPLPAGPSAACPNEAFRTGPSANLPDCRAYESVNPINLLGSRTYVPRIAENGEAAIWETSAGIPGNESNGVRDDYLATRTSSGWSSKIISLPGRMTEVFYGSGLGPVFATANLDGPFIWFIVDAVDPEDPDPDTGVRNFKDLYRTELDGSFTWLSRGSAVAPASFDELSFLGASPDGMTVYFADPRQFEPDAPNGGIYVRSGQTTSVIKDENGDPLPVPGDNDVAGPGVALYPYRLSEDGSAFVLKIRNPVTQENDLYLYEPDLGHAVRLFSAPGAFRLYSISADGSKIFFSAVKDLTPDDVDSGPNLNEGAPFDIYEYDVSAKTLKRLSGTVAGPGPGNGPRDANPVLVSRDGSIVYFTSTEQLEGGKGVSGEQNLYRAEGGTIHYALTVPSGLQRDSFHAQLSGDGKKLILISSDRLTAYDNAGHSELYVYNSSDETTICASCRPDGAAPDGDAIFGSTSFSEGGSAGPNSDVLGKHIVFQSSDAVLPGDKNGSKSDVYEFNVPSGTMSLISTGESPADSHLAGVGGDGRDIFFTTLDSLRPNDQNVGTQKLFDARVGGGFPEPPPPAPCEGEGCRGAGSAKPADIASRTPSFVGPGNPKHKKHKHKKHRHKKHKHKHHGHKKHGSKSQKRDSNRNGRTGR
jgi:Tol biopolymer transport system component